MKNIILLILLLFAVNYSYSQNKSESSNSKNDNAIKFLIKPKILFNNDFVYSMTDTTEIIRSFSDGTTNKISKIVTYFYTFFAPDQPTKENTQVVNFSIDSLLYKYITTDTLIEFDSQNIDQYLSNSNTLPKGNDFIQTLNMLGLEFEALYSPYMEIVNVFGNRYLEMINFYNDTAKAPKDETTRFRYQKSYSQLPLETYFDISKGIYNTSMIAKNDTWNKTIKYDIDGATIIDTAQFKFSNYTSKYYVIEGNTQNISFIPNEKVLINSLNKILTVNKIEGNSDYKINISRNNYVLDMLINSKFDISYNYNFDIIKHTVTTKRHWKLLNTFIR